MFWNFSIYPCICIGDVVRYYFKFGIINSTIKIDPITSRKSVILRKYIRAPAKIELKSAVKVKNLQGN